MTISYASESVINVRPGRAVIANATGSDSRGGEFDVCRHGRGGHRLLRSSQCRRPRRPTSRPASFSATPGRQLRIPELVG